MFARRLTARELVGTDAKGGEVKVRRVRPDGSRNESTTVAESSAARSSGFPHMALVGDEIIFA